MASDYVGGNALGRSGSGSAGNSHDLTALTGGIGSSAAEGDLVIVAMVVGGSATLGDVTLAMVTSGYSEITPAGGLYSADTRVTNLAVFAKFMTSSPDTTAVTGPSQNTAAGLASAVHVWRGVDPTTSLDVAIQTATGIDTVLADPPAITPITAGAVILVIGGGAHTIGAAAVYTTSLDNLQTASGNDTLDAIVGIASYGAWTSGSYDPAAFGFSGSDSTLNSWCAATIALRPASGAGYSLSAAAGSFVLTGTDAELTPSGLRRISHPAVMSTADNVTTAAFTPHANSLLVALCGGNEEDASPVTTTVSDTATLTWTLRASATVSGTASPVWSSKAYIYTAPVGGSPSSMTVTASNADTMNGVFLHVLEYTGHDAASPVGATATGSRQETAGSFSITLDASPAESSEVVALGIIDNYVDSDVFTPGTGWTQLSEETVGESLGQTQVRGLSTSTDVAWTVFDAQTGDSYGFGAAVAIEIKAAAPSGYDLTAGAGSYAFTGQTAALEVGRAVTAGAGSYAFSGTGATLSVALMLPANAGSFALSGTAASLERGYLAAAGAGSFSLSGTDASLEYGYALAAGTGNYTLSGVDAALEFGRLINAGAGAYSLTGQSASLLYGASTELLAEAGSYALTGTAAGLDVTRLLNAGAGSFALSGADAGVMVARLLDAGAGSYALSGVDAVLTYSAGQQQDGDDGGQRRTARFRLSPQDMIRIVEFVEAEKKAEEARTKHPSRRKKKRAIEKAAAQTLQDSGIPVAPSVVTDAVKQATPAFEHFMATQAGVETIDSAQLAVAMRQYLEEVARIALEIEEQDMEILLLAA